MASTNAYEVTSMLQRRCIDSANKLIQLCELHLLRISSLQDINCNFFIALFEGITGYSVPDLLPSTDTFAEEHNVQAIIDTLSLDLLGLPLYHISGESVVSGDPIAISNLLEVLEAVFLHVIEQEDESKDTRDAVSSPKLKSSSPEGGHKKSSSDSSVYDENVPPAKVLKRKICRKTLRKPHISSVYEKNLPCSTSSSSIQEHKVLPPKYQSNGHAYHSTEKDKILKPTKMETTESDARIPKRYPTKDVEKLYDSNFEKKIRALLASDESPRLRALQMKRNYLKSLKSPLKRPAIPVCRKSYLLPYNLRQKPIQHQTQKVHRRKVQREESLKCKKSEKAGRQKTEAKIPLLIETLLDEFPGFHFPKNTLSLLTQHYYQHLGYLHKQMREVYFRKPEAFVEAVKASEEQTKLSNIMAKDLRQRKYLHEVKEQKACESRIRCGFRDARLRSAKLKQYVKEFHTSMQRKLQKRNYSEELVIEKTFKEVLDLQKENVRILCQKVKEADQQDAEQYRKYISSLQNLYKEQLDLLSESLVTKQKESSQRIKDQDLAMRKMDREFCEKLRKDIRALQNDVLEIMKDIHFRELDAENYINQQRLQD